MILQTAMSLTLPIGQRVGTSKRWPERRPRPLGCHNPRVPDREAINAILLVLPP